MFLKFIKIIPLFFLVLINSCNQEESPSEPIVNPEDLILKQKLIGGWGFSNTYIYFNDDGTYIDSSFAYPHPLGGGSDSSNICSEIKKGDLFLDRVTKGLYKIENGYLKKQPIDYIIDCNPLKAPGCYLYVFNYIEIINDTLNLTTNYIWQRSDNETESIWGTWRQIFWAWSYDNQLPLGGAPQLITETATFYKDSSYYIDKMEGLPYAGIEWRRQFEYEPPIFYGKNDNTFFTVSFNGKEMFWLQKYRTRKYYRIK